MYKFQTAGYVSLLTLMLSGCMATQSQTQHQQPTASLPQKTVTLSVATDEQPALHNSGIITLEQIMADPDWLGRQPLDPQWTLSGTQIQYERKREGSHLRDVYVAAPGMENNGDVVTLSTLHNVQRDYEIHNIDGSMSAWVFESNIFVFNAQTNTTKQLTKNSAHAWNLVFLVDGRIGFQQGSGFYAVDPNTGAQQQLAEWHFKEAPVAVKPAADFIAREQHELIDYVALKRSQRQAQADYDRALAEQNSTLSLPEFYLPKGHEVVQIALSPKADYIVVATRKDVPTRQDSDIMPNYIQEDGRIAAESVRRRVADAVPESHQLWLMDLNSQTLSSLSLKALPGYNDDVLADVKRENAQARGEDYQVNRLPRDIGLLQSWYGQPAITWNKSGTGVAIMLEAWDNKDRWIVTVDTQQKRLVTQHRLSDEAWINYAFNQFGWLNKSDAIYYLSEETGYAHLYVKPLNGQAEALTSGRYEVDDVTFSHDDRYAYFKANVKHPGIYEIYRVDTENGSQQALTDLNGMTDYALNRQQDSILLTHSTLTMPPELYSMTIDEQGGSAPVRITNTVSDAFLSMPWTAPSIVPVDSSHVSDPIYSRVYLPQGQSDEKRRAVIFNHGAGYLQNSHMGWSGYFREFMFHSMLAQQGYVVMDMDYRASKGYGRDWRTAIYRQMGTPETQDLVDGVNWLVENANVDRQRIGTYGGSYGGFMTFMALFTEPELFQAGAALRPVSDWAHYNHPYTSNILNTPDVDPIAYRRSSPIYFAEGLNKPLLMNAPMIDDNVFFVDVVRLVQRLIELEKQDFETAIYPVEPHGFVQPSSWLDEYRRIYKLFEQHL